MKLVAWFEVNKGRQQATALGLWMTVALALVLLAQGPLMAAFEAALWTMASWLLLKGAVRRLALFDPYAPTPAAYTTLSRAVIRLRALLGVGTIVLALLPLAAGANRLRSFTNYDVLTHYDVERCSQIMWLAFSLQLLWLEAASARLKYVACLPLINLFSMLAVWLPAYAYANNSQWGNHVLSGFDREAWGTAAFQYGFAAYVAVTALGFGAHLLRRR